MPSDHNYALYYPTIEFVDYEWLWSAALLWDRIYRIVPSSYEPADPDNVKVLVEAGEIGIPIRPDAYTRQVADEFIDRLESGEWTAAALGEVPPEYARLHRDKVDVRLRELIIAKGSDAARSEWFHVSREFEAHYLTYLANHVADMNGLQLLSDSSIAWTGSTYFRYDGAVEDYPDERSAQQLAILVVRDFLPENVRDITPNSLLRFREQYRGERERFLLAIRKSAEMLANCEDKGVVRDRLEDIKKDIESALRDYRQSLRALNVVSMAGMKSVTFPVVTKVASEIAGKDLDTTTLMVVSALGVAVGLVSGLLDFKQKRRALEKESDYSYLLHLDREWKGQARHGHDYNYWLCREMEEFLND